MRRSATTIGPGSVAVSFHRIAGGFNSPVSVTSARDGSGRLFVVEQGGRVRVFHNGAIASKVYLNIASRVVSGGEQGLLSIAFHPDFRKHPTLFAAYTRASDGAIQVSRFRATSPAATSMAASTEVRILTIPHPDATNHNGGQLMFGNGGDLYITTGDGGNEGDSLGYAEKLTSGLAKILRIDINRSCGSHHYCVPKSNPFSGSSNATKRLVYEWGLRNPWRASIDRATGSLWIGDVGQDTYEEVDHTATGGHDFGWSCREGPAVYNSGNCSGRHPKGPLTYYKHVNGRCAIIGGNVYRGPDYTFAHGLYVYGDYCTGELWALGHTSTGWHHSKVGALGKSSALSGFGVDGRGEIFAVELGGGLYHLRFRKG